MWVTMSAVMDSPYFQQKNAAVERWNAAVVERGFSEIDLVLDVFPLSRRFAHVDNIHLSRSYYKAVASGLPMRS